MYQSYFMREFAAEIIITIIILLALIGYAAYMIKMIYEGRRKKEKDWTLQLSKVERDHLQTMEYTTLEKFKSVAEFHAGLRMREGYEPCYICRRIAIKCKLPV